MNPTPAPHITPADAQVLVIAWLNVVYKILEVAIPAAFGLYGIFQAQKAKAAAALAKQHSELNEKRLDRQGDTLKTVLRDLPPSPIQSTEIGTTST